MSLFSAPAPLQQFPQPQQQQQAHLAAAMGGLSLGGFAQPLAQQQQQPAVNPFSQPAQGMAFGGAPAQQQFAPSASNNPFAAAAGVQVGAGAGAAGAPTAAAAQKDAFSDFVTF